MKECYRYPGITFNVSFDDLCIVHSVTLNWKRQHLKSKMENKLFNIPRTKSLLHKRDLRPLLASLQCRRSNNLVPRVSHLTAPEETLGTRLALKGEGGREGKTRGTKCKQRGTNRVLVSPSTLPFECLHVQANC